MTPRTGPRAIAVLEVDAQKKSRLVPVALIYETRFYDANLYQRNPIPMALGRDVVYDVLQANQRVGTFTNHQARKVQDVWYGLGVWKSKEEAEKAKTAEAEEDRPVLRRSGDKSEASTEKAAATPSPSPAASPTATPAPRDDKDRPTLRRTVRGQNPTADQNAAEEVMMTPLRSAAAPASIRRPAGKDAEYIAISDLEETDYRSMAMALTPEEEAGHRQKLFTLVQKELATYTSARGIKLPPVLNVTDYELRAFDADYSNNPQLVLTFSYTPPAAPNSRPVVLYGTIVARVDYTSEPQKLFSQITDSTRLGTIPRLELVDIADVEGYQRGSLIFRQYRDTGRGFVVYRVETYGLNKLFEGASGE